MINYIYSLSVLTLHVGRYLQHVDVVHANEAYEFVAHEAAEKLFHWPYLLARQRLHESGSQRGHWDGGRRRKQGK